MANKRLNIFVFYSCFCQSICTNYKSLFITSQHRHITHQCRLEQHGDETGTDSQDAGQIASRESSRSSKPKPAKRCSSRCAANSPRWPWQGDARLVLLDFCRLQRITQIRSISQGMIVIWAKYLLQWNGGEGINKHIELLLGHLQVLSGFHITTNPRTYFISVHHHHEWRERSDWPSGSWWWQCSRLWLNTSLKTDFI